MTQDSTNPLGINDGTRPSLLDLDRRLVGEQSGDIPEAHRIATEAAAQDVPPLDIAALRSRARVTDRPVRRPKRWLFAGLVAASTMAAAGALVVQPMGTPTAEPMVRAKGGAQLGWMVLRDDGVQMGSADQTVAAGDRIQFTWAGNDVSSAVVIGVDGTGTSTVLWPADGGDVPVPLHGASGMLDGSVKLDDAPGPERFFIVFNAASVSEANKRVAEGMQKAHSRVDLEAWAGTTADIDVLILEKEL